MGKSKRNKSKNFHRHNPLDQEILENRFAQPSSRQKTRSKQPKEDECVDNRLTNEILKQARKQQEDLEEEQGISPSSVIAPHSSLGSSEGDDEDDHSPQNESDNEDESTAISSSEDTELQELLAEIDEDEEKALDNFMCKDSQKRATLADAIRGALAEKKSDIYSAYSDVGSLCNEAPLKDEETFKEVGLVLKDYRSGKLPKAFKSIPNFIDWERRLFITEPDKWSRASMYQATRIFASNLEDRMAQRFYNRILLPRLRDEIAECKTLSFHLYQAFKKALFKPAAFFKGIILPLCKSKDCTLREATIFGSVLAKCSIPVLQSSAALLSIAEMEYSGANSIFMRNLIEKRYALPYRVVNGVVDHFLRFMEDNRKLPLLWHQCLLTFVQIYKFDISKEQKADLSKLLTVHHHEHVTPEIRKELQNTVGLPTVTQHLLKL